MPAEGTDRAMSAIYMNFSRDGRNYRGPTIQPYWEIQEFTDVSIPYYRDLYPYKLYLD